MNTVQLITTKAREEVFVKTKEFWESYDWKVIPIYNDKQHPSKARNKLLRNFYDSNEDWICIADDDQVLMTEEEFKDFGAVRTIVGEVDYPKLNYRQFLTNNEQIFNNENLPISFGPSSCVNLAGRWNMVRLAKQYNDSQIFNDNWVFERFAKVAYILFQQNTKKKFNKEFFQDTSIGGLEDWEFSMQQIDNGFATARLDNIICKEISKRTSLFEAETVKESQSKRKIAFDQGKDLIINKYEGTSLMKNGGLQLRYWMKRVWKPQRGWTAERIPRLMIKAE